MMCISCRDAGEAFRQGNVEAATELHRSCVDTTCTCQHRTVPHMINQERIETKDWVAQLEIPAEEASDA